MNLVKKKAEHNLKGVLTPIQPQKVENIPTIISLVYFNTFYG